MLAHWSTPSQPVGRADGESRVFVAILRVAGSRVSRFDLLTDRNPYCCNDWYLSQSALTSRLKCLDGRIRRYRPIRSGYACEMAE